MDTEAFLKAAREGIAATPRERLTPNAEECIDDPMGIIDIHTHIFDKRCLSVRYIALRMLKSMILGKLGIEAETLEEELVILSKDEDELYDDIALSVDDETEDWEQLEKEIEKTVEIYETYEIFGFDLKEALRVLKKDTMEEVLDYYHEAFSIANLNTFQKAKVMVGVLQMDLETSWKFKPRRKYRQQIKEIKEISKKHPIIPYLAVDPRRAEKEGADENLYELFLEAFVDKETPFFGVKCYPSMGYFPEDIRLDPIFKICAEKGIPVLTHCGGETVSTFEKSIQVKRENGYEDFEIPGKKRKFRARYLNEPQHWEPVLKKYPNLKLNFGHFGGGDNWLDYEKFGKNERLEKIFEMMRNPAWKVYADFSFSVIEDELFDGFKTYLDANPDIAARALYGTDYWVVLPAGDLLKEQDKFLKKLVGHRQAMLRDNIITYLMD